MCPAGLVMSIMGKTKGGAVKIYQITYIFGFFLGVSLHLVVNKIFPPQGLGIDEPFDDLETVEGVAPSEDGCETPTKEPITVEKQVIDDLKV